MEGKIIVKLFTRMHNYKAKFLLKKFGFFDLDVVLQQLAM